MDSENMAAHKGHPKFAVSERQCCEQCEGWPLKGVKYGTVSLGDRGRMKPDIQIFLDVSYSQY